MDDYELGKQLTITMIHQLVNDNLWTVIIMMIKCTVVRRGETKVSYYEEKGKGEGAQQLSIKWIEVRIPRHASVLLGTLGKGSR